MRKSFLILALAALVCASTGLTGCQQRKSKKPTPESTALGTGSGDVLPITSGGDGTLGGDGTNGNLMPRDPNALAGANGTQGRGVLESVLFDFDRAEVRSSEKAKLESAASYLKTNAQARLLLEGYCDWRGTTEYNLGLGDRRAQAVRTYLETLGVKADRLDLISKGDTEAKEGAAAPDMAKDRRVEFVVLSAP